jgi:hypothetical protein
LSGALEEQFVAERLRGFIRRPVLVERQVANVSKRVVWRWARAICHPYSFARQFFIESLRTFGSL